MIARIAFLAFPGLTLLDLVGVYDALRRIAAMGIDPDVSVRILGTKATILDDTGVAILPDAVYEDLRPYDLLIVPGGSGTRAMMADAQCLEYLKGWKGGSPIASVCTGALLLGAAGHLKGKRATTHHLALDALKPYCKEVVSDQRIVEDGLVTTAAGVTSSLDLGLYIVERWWGVQARERIADVMAYRGYDPT